MGSGIHNNGISPQKKTIKWRDGLALAVGAGAGIAGYALFHEPLNVRLDRLDLRLKNAQGRIPPSGLRILHLSDTHFRGATWREQPKIEHIRRLCQGLEYDLMIHTGDFLHYDSGLPNLMALFDAIPKPRLGAYAVLGNHDYMTYSYRELMSRSWEAYQQETHLAQVGANATAHFSVWTWLGLLVRFGYYFVNAPLALKRSGPNDIAKLEAALAQRDIQMLYNRAVQLKIPSARATQSYTNGNHTSPTPRNCPAEPLDLWLAGVDDLTEGSPNLDNALARVPDDALLMLLAHNPDILYHPQVGRADLILSGHTHGGQIVLPFMGAAHTQTIHLHRREVSGYLQRGKSHIYITRGIGEGIPIRFAAPPQIALITLYPDEECKISL